MQYQMKNVLTLALCTMLFHTAHAAADVKAPHNLQTQKIEAPVGSQAMTMEQAMADADWLGRQAEASYWAPDSSAIFYLRKQAGNELRDLFQVSADGANNLVPLNDYDDAGSAEQVFNADRSIAAWVFEDNLYVKDLRNGQLQQLSKDRQAKSDLQFLADGRLSYRQGWNFYAVDIAKPIPVLLASLQTSAAPKAPSIEANYLAQEQHELIKFIAKEHRDAKDAFERQQQLARENASMAVAPIYFNAAKQIQAASLSPNGRYLLVVLGEKRKRNPERDIMPNYITPSGNIVAEPVRPRVHDEQPESQQFFLTDLVAGSSKELSLAALPGFDEDVLAAVKAENAKARGETYQASKKARPIRLIDDWSWSQSAIQWNNLGDTVAVMLKASDNKDRWLVTSSTKSPAWQTQHRLHDDAWIAYDFNEFGWVNPTQLYFLSEETGYSHLYVKPLSGSAKALTAGRFEVSQPVLSRDGSTIYYRANVTHPGIYNLYKVGTRSAKSEALTQLKGNLSFSVAPDESKFLVRYSTLTQPEELYVLANQSQAELKRVTYTVSEQLKQMALAVPQVVAVPSSHGEQPVYAKLYLPKAPADGQKLRAVIFNHGAGYLQNSDLGWSGYFHEFFFHTLLVQKGYVVLDMDYRASKGYGRDWRTAIYRQMGTPEIQDLQDGVEYLVKHANVDRERIGTYGGSYGGFMTFMAMFTQPDLFKAGAALRPVGDWAYYNQPYTANILNTPDIDPIAYRRSSPIYFTQGLKGRLLINAPMVDNNVFFQDTVRVVQRLIEQEINSFETAIFPVEPHGFRQPSSWLDEYRRIEKLFDQTL